MRRGQTLTNLAWKIGPCTIIDVSTKLLHAKTVIIDTVDYEKVVSVPGRWYAYRQQCGAIYAARSVRIGPKTRTIAMHRWLCPDVPCRDHQDGDGLNNTGKNLRACVNSQNIRNRRMHKNNSVGFKGVTTHGNHYRARIRDGGRYVSVGTFATPEEAARAYNAAAVRCYGAFARLNEGV